MADRLKTLRTRAHQHARHPRRAQRWPQSTTSGRGSGSKSSECLRRHAYDGPPSVKIRKSGSDTSGPLAFALDPAECAPEGGRSGLGRIQCGVRLFRVRGKFSLDGIAPNLRVVPVSGLMKGEIPGSSFVGAVNIASGPRPCVGAMARHCAIHRCKARQVTTPSRPAWRRGNEQSGRRRTPAVSLRSRTSAEFAPIPVAKSIHRSL